LVIPNQAVATYTTKTEYDSWNRLLKMTYPDGEIVNYTYNVAGLLNKVTGTKGSETTNYVTDIKYDEFEQRSYIKYGNGTETNYTYKPQNRLLNTLSVQKGTTMLMNNAYNYDAVQNVTDIVNSGNPNNSIGGNMTHHYTYDNLYRLDSASGDFMGYNGKKARYSLKMEYDNMHNIIRKKQDIVQNGIKFDGILNAGYDLSYTYANNSQQIANIAEQSYRIEGEQLPSPQGEGLGVRFQTFTYDPNGNMTFIATGKLQSDSTLQATSTRKMLWDEENRLQAVSDNGFVSNYWYDASGERTVKESFDNEGVYVNGVLSGARTGTSKFTAYVSPYLVVSNGGNYTKHIYMGSQRITSKIGNSGIFTTRNPLTDTTALNKSYTTKLAGLTNTIKERFDSLGVKYSGTTQTGGLVSLSADTASSSYFYHSDHLGSSSLITDGNGSLVQHLEYVPFGETFIDERNGNWSTPYLFNAKEQDEETGLHYFGARYYDSKTSVWLSVDPLAEKYPNVSSFVYCHSNPVNMLDPDGRGDYYHQETGVYLGTDNITDNFVYSADGKNNDGSFSNSILLSMTHSEFQKSSNVVRQESHSDDSNEDLWIAHTANNNAKSNSTSLYEKLMSGYSCVSDKSALSDNVNTADANSARAAVIDVLSGGVDPTGGATFWDGTDFLVWGLNSPYGNAHAKFRQYSSIEIGIDTYVKYENAQKELYGNSVKYGGKKYSIPASVFNNSENWYISTSTNPQNWWGFFHYDTGVKGNSLISTGSVGRSIFWKTK
jgi:RHS repeat-associated protein